MNYGDFVFGVGLKSNKETNDFLRCLWARMAATFGKFLFGCLVSFRLVIW